MLNNKKIIVVLPAYNAEKTLEETYREIPFDIVDDVIVVDDASIDNTVEVAKRIGIQHIIVHEKNKGYGGNQKAAYRWAIEHGLDIVVLLHADGQYAPEVIEELVTPFETSDCDAVFGSRFMDRGSARIGGMPLYKYLSNRALTFAENLLTGAKLSEYHTGYRAFSRELLERVPFERNSDDFIFDNQMIAQILWLGYTVAEVSCPTKYFAEASSINFFRSLRYGFGCLATGLAYRLAKMGLIRPGLFQGREG